MNTDAARGVRGKRVHLIVQATACAFRFLRQPSKLLMLFPLPPARAAGVQLPKLRWYPSAVLPFHRPRFSLLPSRLQPHMIRGQRGP